MSLCPREGCGADETIEHVFRECRFARKVWSELVLFFPRLGSLKYDMIMLGLGLRGKGREGFPVVVGFVYGKGGAVGCKDSADKEQFGLAGGKGGGKGEGRNWVHEKNGGGKVRVSCRKRAMEDIIFMRGRGFFVVVFLCFYGLCEGHVVDYFDCFVMLL